MIKLPQIGQGPAKEANADEIQYDETGFTNPNLHRRIYTPSDGTENTRLAYTALILTVPLK